jgi:hypothetical protein
MLTLLILKVDTDNNRHNDTGITLCKQVLAKQAGIKSKKLVKIIHASLPGTSIITLPLHAMHISHHHVDVFMSSTVVFMNSFL